MVDPGELHPPQFFGSIAQHGQKRRVSFNHATLLVNEGYAEGGFPDNRAEPGLTFHQGLLHPAPFGNFQAHLFVGLFQGIGPGSEPFRQLDVVAAKVLDEHLVLHQYQVGADGRQGATQNAQVDVRTGGAAMSKENVPEQLEDGDGHNYLQRYHDQPGNPGIIRAFVLWRSFDGDLGSQFPLVSFHMFHTLPSSLGVKNLPVFNLLQIYRVIFTKKVIRYSLNLKIRNL